jgi:hypothetical protein
MKREDWQAQGLHTPQATTLPYTESLFGNTPDAH